MCHVTRASNIDSILTHGLVPRLGERSLEFGEPCPAVYAFPTVDDCHFALSQWLGEWFNDEEEATGANIDLVIIAFDSQGLRQLPADVAFEARFSETIPPNAFRELYTEEGFGRLFYNQYLSTIDIAA